MKRNFIYIILIFVMSFTYAQSHFNVDISVTGESQPLIFLSSVGLEEGDEVGIFDANGLLTGGGCSSDVGEILVGADIWTGDGNLAFSIGRKS